MPLVNIARAFMLHFEDTGEKIPVAAGAQNLPDKVANHWYTKMNIQQPPPSPGTDSLQPRLEAEQALRNAQVELRAHADAASATAAVDAAYRDALAASEARNGELQRRLDQHMQEAAAQTQAAATYSDTAHSGASSQMLVPTQGEAGGPGAETGGETDDVLKARAEAEMLGTVVGKTNSTAKPADGEGKPDDSGDDTSTDGAVKRAKKAMTKD